MKDVETKLKKKKLSWKVVFLKLIDPEVQKLREYYINTVNEGGLIYDLVVILYSIYKLNVYKKIE